LEDGADACGGAGHQQRIALPAPEQAANDPLNGVPGGGAGVKRETAIATAKFTVMPSAPIPSGEMPNHQVSATFAPGFTNLK